MAVDEFSDITLRLMDLSDIDNFMVWATDDEVSRFCTWDTFNSKEQGICYITDTILPHPWYRAICLQDRPVGAISVRPVASVGDHRSTAQISYGLASAYWGRGIMTRAVKMAAAAIFRDWPDLLRLQALVDVENVGSIRVLEKAGFRREGVLRKYLVLKGRARDMVMFSLLSSDDLQS